MSLDLTLPFYNHILSVQEIKTSVLGVLSTSFLIQIYDVNWKIECYIHSTKSNSSSNKCPPK